MSQPWGSQPYSPDAQQPYPGQPYPGQPYPGQPYPGPAYSDPSAALQPFSGQPFSGQPFSGQPYAGQPYPDTSAQPYAAGGIPGQPYAGQPYGQPYGHPGAGPQAALVSPGGRLGAVLLDLLLSILTLGVGFLIWSMITWSDGQSPAKKILGYVVVDVDTGRPFDWGRMAVRQFAIMYLLGGFLGTITFGIYHLVDAFMIFGDGHRTLHDKFANSVVVRVD